MRIREASPGEAGSLTSIAQESKAHWGYPADVLAAWRPQLTITPQDIISHATCVAESDAEVVGFYMLGQSGADCALEHLWVRPRWMRRGVGAMLLQHALQLARDRRHAMVRVVSDPHAAEFYLRQGGRSAGHVPAPLPDAPDRRLPVYEFALAEADALRRQGGA
jgi:GNAT superfamily N-acetyltransferase